MTARICIVTASAIGSNPRVVKEAEALAAEGHQVHVIAVRTLALVDARDEDILAQAAWSCERIDLRAPANRIFGKIAQILARAIYRLTGLAAERALSPMTGRLVRRARAYRADLYIAHYDPALPAAAAAAQLWNGRYAFDAEDFHPGDLADTPENREQNGLIASVERRFLPGCAYITAASPGIADAYAKAYGLPNPVVVLNVFPLSRAAPIPTNRGVATPGPTVYWFSQTIGPDRGLENAVAAIAQSRTRPHLHLRGQASAGYREVLERNAAQLGISDRLHIHPPASPLDMERLAAAYDVGLASETGQTPNHKIALANKLFSYFLAGLPVVLSDTQGHRSFASQVGEAAFLFPAGSPDGLAARLDELLTEPATLSRARRAAWRLGQQRFNWEHEAKVLLACVDAALGEAS